MSRNSRWRTEKINVKVVFRLQFHATHIPQTGWNNLFISLDPSDSGKETAKTSKANVRNGACKWVDPIYVTTTLLQAHKTNHYEDKLYKLLVAMGTSRSSVLGVAKVNLCDYVNASIPTVAVLPLCGSVAGAILHVTVQLLTSKNGFREFEHEREIRDRGLLANIDHHSEDLSALGGAVVSCTDKVKPQFTFNPEPEKFQKIGEGSCINKGFSNSSGSSNAEKHESNGTREIDSIKNTVSVGQRRVSPAQSPIYEKSNLLQRDMEIVYLTMHELQKEITSLQNFANGLSVQVNKMSEQIAVEISLEQRVAKDVSMLQMECVSLKQDLKWMRNLKMNPSDPGRKLKDADQATQVQSLTLRWTRALQDMEDKIFQLQNKVCHGTDGKDLIILQSDLEELHDVLIDLKQGADHSIFSVPGLLTSEASSVDSSSAMQGEICKLRREVDESNTERENIVRKMEEMKSYYEGLIHELEKNQKEILGELQSLKHEHASCMHMISSDIGQMEVMNQRMMNERLQLNEEKHSLDVLNKKLQKRVVNSKEAMQKAKMNYSVSIDQWQKDLEVLSSQVHSMFETNKILIGKALECSLYQSKEYENRKNHHVELDGFLEDQSKESENRKNHHVESDGLLEDQSKEFENRKNHHVESDGLLEDQSKESENRKNHHVESVRWTLKGPKQGV